MQITQLIPLLNSNKRELSNEPSFGEIFCFCTFQNPTSKNQQFTGDLYFWTYGSLSMRFTVLVFTVRSVAVYSTVLSLTPCTSVTFLKVFSKENQLFKKFQLDCMLIYHVSFVVEEVLTRSGFGG